MIPILWAPAIFSRSRISQYWNTTVMRRWKMPAWRKREVQIR
jgi:hypothetical protein